MSATHRPPTSNATPHFVEVVAATVERFGHRPLLSAHGSGAALTYADVWGWAGASAQRLAGVGATPGERVVVRAPKSVEMLIAYLAALRLGAVWTPVAPTATTTELNQVIDDAEPRVVIDGNRALCDMVGAAPAGAPEPQPGDWPNPTPGPDQIAAMLYTSGTTGRPKGVPITGGAERQRPCTGGRVAVHRTRCAGARSAHPSCPRPVRGRGLRAGVWLVDAVDRPI